MPIPTTSSTQLSITPQRLLLAWLQIGAQSFGGGTSTLALIQRTFVQQLGWLTDARLARINAIGQVVPGINLLAISIQIGQELAGPTGILVSLVGLLLPSVAITILMTGGYAAVRNEAGVKAAFHGIMPATIGIGALTAFSMGRAMLRESRVIGGSREIVVAIIIFAGAAAAMAAHAPVIVVLCGGGLVMAVARGVSARARSEAAEPSVAAEEAALAAEEANEER